MNSISPRIQVVSAKSRNAKEMTGASDFSTLLNILNSMIGAGILSIPYTVYCSGILGSFLLLVISFFFSLFGAYCLSVSSVYTKEETFGRMATQLYNKPIAVLTDVFMTIYNFGTSVAYFIIMFDEMRDLAESFSIVSVDVYEEYKWIITLTVTLVISVPLLALRNMDALKYTSAIAIVSVLFFIVISIKLGVEQLIEIPLAYSLWPNNVSSIATAISVYSTALCYHTNIPVFVKELSSPPQADPQADPRNKIRRMTRLSIIANAIGIVMYFIVGTFAYFAFGSFISGNLLNNLASSNVGYMKVFGAAYLMVITFSNPVIVYPSLLTFDKWLFSTERTRWRRMMESFLWCMASWVVAIAIPKLDIIFSLTGSLSGIALIYISPALYYLGVSKRKHVNATSILGPKWIMTMIIPFVIVCILMSIIAIIAECIRIFSYSVLYNNTGL